MTPRPIAVLTLLACLIAAPRALAQDSAKLGELERKVDMLTQEIEKLKLGEASEPAAEGSQPGFAPAASKVYRARRARCRSAATER